MTTIPPATTRPDVRIVEQRNLLKAYRDDTGAQLGTAERSRGANTDWIGWHVAVGALRDTVLPRAEAKRLLTVFAEIVLVSETFEAGA